MPEFIHLAPGSVPASWIEHFGPEVCAEINKPSAWCPDCGRLRGVGCACGMTFAEKIRTVAIDKTSLKASDRS